MSGASNEAVAGWANPNPPPWATGDMPDSNLYVESERFVAGALSTLPPLDAYHPAWALPFARQALRALSEWEPSWR